MRTAQSWNAESVFSRHVTALDDHVDVDVSAEVPMSATGERVPRYGNRYFPTLVKIAGDDGLFWLCHPDEARALATALWEAADAADAIDQPDCAPCGHWAPCSRCLFPAPAAVSS
jgi:hypothetical protein